MGDYIGNYYRVINGDTRSLDSGSYSEIAQGFWGPWLGF